MTSFLFVFTATAAVGLDLSNSSQRRAAWRKAWRWIIRCRQERGLDNALPPDPFSCSQSIEAGKKLNEFNVVCTTYLQNLIVYSRKIVFDNDDPLPSVQQLPIIVNSVQIR